MISLRFLHLSYDAIEKFELRDPLHRIEGEDSSVRRICLSTSIESAVNAKPGRAELLKIALDRDFALAFYLYIPEVTEDDVIPPHILVQKYGVLDAELNQEYWLTQVPACKKELYLLDSAEVEQEKGWIYPRVRSVQAHRISELPQFCVQRWVEEANAYMHTDFSASLLLGELPEIEKRLMRRSIRGTDMEQALKKVKRKAPIKKEKK